MLTGIARLAAASPLLDAKRQVQYYELPIRSILNRVRQPMPFAWAINPYRGCEFACRYCYARYTHEFMELHDEADFDNRIFAKMGAARALERELTRVPRQQEIAIGTATDPYQPAERKYRVTRALLEVFAGHKGRHLSVTTKSDLVCRDLELLREIARSNVLHCNMTITTTDARLAGLLEPRAPRPELRLRAVEKLTKAGISCGVFASPVLPYLTDRDDELDAVARAAGDAGAGYFGVQAVFLKPSAQKVFVPFLEAHFPELAARYRRQFERDPYLRGTYPESLRARADSLRRRYGLASAPLPYLPELWEEPPSAEQLVLFPQPAPTPARRFCRA